jgi:hypothetical protein
MKKNKLMTEEVQRILEIMHGEDFMPKGIILESTGNLGKVFLTAFVKRVTSKLGYGLLGDAQVSKWFNKLMDDLNKDFPRLRWNKSKKTYDQAAWEDAIEYIFSVDKNRAKYLRELFGIEVIQKDMIEYLKVAYRGFFTKAGSEAAGMKKFVDDLLDSNIYDDLFSATFKKDLTDVLKLLRDSLGGKFLNKIAKGDFSGMRTILSWTSSSHRAWIDDVMPNLSVIGARGRGYELVNTWRLTLGAMQAPFTLLSRGFKLIPEKMLGYVKWAFKIGMGLLSANYIFKMVSTALTAPIHQVMTNGAKIYEDSGPLARHLFKIKDSKATEIAKWINDEVDDTFVDEKGIQDKLKSAGSKYGICQVAHRYEQLYKDRQLWSDIQKGARVTRLSLDKFSPFDGIKDYSDIINGLTGMVEVEKNEKNKELASGIMSVLEIPRTDSFMEEGPLVIDNGKHAAYYKKGKYPPADIVFRLGEYFYQLDNSYDDSTFRDNLKTMTTDAFKAALSDQAGEMFILPGEEEYGEFKPNSQEYIDNQEELLKDNKSEIKETFDETVKQLGDWMENLVQSIGDD